MCVNGFSFGKIARFRSGAVSFSSSSLIHGLVSSGCSLLVAAIVTCYCNKGVDNIGRTSVSQAHVKIFEREKEVRKK
jgi:hypothetical protein